MGAVFRRRKQTGEKGLIWRIKYRIWDRRAKKWGGYKYESAGTAIRREAEKLLEERELEEQRKSVGLSRALETRTLREALVEFIDETHSFDREVPERNLRTTHPLLETAVEGKPWWIRTLDFARDVDRCFGRVDACALLEPGAFEKFARFLESEGGRRDKGVAQSTKSKTLKWLRRFCAWSVMHGYLAIDPSKHFKIPSEVVKRQDSTIEASQMNRFLAEYQRLSLKARVRVGLALWTGARSGEIESIRVVDVRPEAMTVRREIQKRAAGPQERIVRVPATLIEDLLAWIESNELGSEDRLLPIRGQAGVKFLRRWRTTARGLRRTVLTALLESGASLRVIQEAAGHSRLDTTQRYLGVGENAVSDALAQLGWAIDHDESGETCLQAGALMTISSASPGRNLGRRVRRVE